MPQLLPPLISLLLSLLPGVADPPTSPVEEPSLKRLQALAGTWVLIDPEGDATDLRATYATVAGGSAVLETLFVGAPEETVTLYHQEGRSVTVTQLSARAAPMRFTPVPGSARDELRFEIEAKEVAEGEVMVLLLALLDDEHLRLQWFLKGAGERLTPRTLELRRDGPLEELASEVARLRVSLESLQEELDRRIKREVRVEERGASTKVLRETRTFPMGPGWSVTGTPFREVVIDDTQRFASTFAARGDEGMTLAHYAFEAGSDCRLEFSVLGGHGYVVVVEETRSPARKIRSIPDFTAKLNAGEYGTIVRRVVGGRWRDDPRSVVWDLSEHAGKGLRLYLVDDATDHWGQIGISDVRILEQVR